MSFPEPQPSSSPENGNSRSRKQAVWSKFWRIGLGSLLILAGIAMLVLPGPGIVTIIAGLAVMASEVPPAERLMHYLRERFSDALEAAKAKRRKK